jgi:signal transduction histidine kinase
MILSVDITDRKRLEALARRGERIEQIGELAGGVSHDFNNFLTIITAYGTLVAEQLPADHPAHADVVAILETARRGAELTRKLLTFAKQAPSGARVTSVHHALTEFSEILRRAVPRTIALTLDVPNDVGHVRIEPTALDQVVMNLVVNARDAIGTAHGSIAIEAERLTFRGTAAAERGTRLPAGEYVRVSVRDDGAGIPPSIIDRIFDPFFTTKPPELGTGLGLATCWGLVERAGGAMTVSSEPDVATVFCVYLPRVEDSPEAEPTALQ